VTGIDNHIEDLTVLFFPVKIEGVMGHNNRGRNPAALPTNGKDNLLVGPLLDICRKRSLGSLTDDVHPVLQCLFVGALRIRVMS
jgi:hypothetical protein